MRVSSTMMSNNYLKQLNGTYEQYTKLMEQSDGSKLHRASDDSVGYSKYLRFQNSLTTNEQFQANTKTAVSWMKNSDAAMVNVADLMNTFKDKTVAAGNSTNNESDMKDIAKELLANVQEIVSDLNSQIGDRYLFSGQSDTTRPFAISDEKQTRGEVKTLSDEQSAFFSDTKTSGAVTQMLVLQDENDVNNYYYLDTHSGNVYTRDFVENGYKDVITSGRNTVDAGDKVGNITIKVEDNFNKYGVINDAGKAWTGTVDGKTVKFATHQQYIVEYQGDAKYISMVKQSGGEDKATDSVNVTGQDLFGADIFDCDLKNGAGDNVSSGTAMLNELLSVVSHIDAADYKWAGKDGVTIAEAAHTKVIGAETTMAARQQAYTAAQTMLVTQNESITSDISDVSSTDVAYLATMLMTYQTIYSLSLSVGSKILPGTLADYL